MNLCSLVGKAIRWRFGSGIQGTGLVLAFTQQRLESAQGGFFNLLRASGEITHIWLAEDEIEVLT